ncbi:hypothetical protein EBZ39_05960 [bacterium]|nr:hypothetical protein [bacterium]
MFGTNLNKSNSRFARNPRDPVRGAIPRYLRYDMRREFIDHYAFKRFYSWSFFITVMEPHTGVTVSFRTRKFPMEASPVELAKTLENMPGLLNILVDWHECLPEKDFRL